MGGGLMQLVAYGAQDIYLTGNPQITFFKVVYRRHTNFSIEAIEQTFNGKADFGDNVSATISRNGDLVYRMYLEHNVSLIGLTKEGAGVDDSSYINICSNYGSNLIKECEIEIGGQTIDKHYNHWHSVYSQLTEYNPDGLHSNGLPNGVPAPEAWRTNAAIKSSLFNTMSGNGGPITTGLAPGEEHLGSWEIVCRRQAADGAQSRIFIPLYFWFCRNPGLALPLIALQYHEVKVKMNFENKINLFSQMTESGIGQAVDADDLLGHNASATTTGTAVGVDLALHPSTLNITDLEVSQAGWTAGSTESDFVLWCDYIYLDTDERRRFAQVSHEYLIEQLQFEQFNSKGDMVLNFNHPVKELIWTHSTSQVTGVTGTAVVEPGSLSDTVAQSTSTFWPPATGAVYTLQQTSEMMLKREPETITGNFQLKLNGHDRFKERDAKYFTRTQIWEHHTGYGSTIKPDAIAVYSFALKPEEHQPSGTCNFSRIDNAQLTGPGGNYNVYAVNYNVLRIMSGMGGLAYSN